MKKFTKLLFTVCLAVVIFAMPVFAAEPEVEIIEPVIENMAGTDEGIMPLNTDYLLFNDEVIFSSPIYTIRPVAGKTLKFHGVISNKLVIKVRPVGSSKFVVTYCNDPGEHFQDIYPNCNGGEYQVKFESTGGCRITNGGVYTDD